MNWSNNYGNTMECRVWVGMSDRPAEYNIPNQTLCETQRCSRLTYTDKATNCPGFYAQSFKLGMILGAQLHVSIKMSISLLIHSWTSVPNNVLVHYGNVRAGSRVRYAIADNSDWASNKSSVYEKINNTLISLCPLLSLTLIQQWKLKYKGNCWKLFDLSFVGHQQTNWNYVNLHSVKSFFF